MRSIRAVAGLAASAASAAIAFAHPAFAQSAPTALRGKSVIVSWTENRRQRFEGEVAFRPVAVPQSLQIYVSADGRTFERRNVGGASKERVGGGAIAANSAPSRFQGSTLIVAGATRGGGARQVVVTFEQGFSSCSAKVTVGREPGAEFVKGTHMALKRPIEFHMEGVTGESCSIQSGNVFAR